MMSCFDELLCNAAFPYRNKVLHSIQNWIEHVLSSKNLVLQNHLADSLETCLPIMNEATTRITVSRALQSNDPFTKHMVQQVELNLQQRNQKFSHIHTINNQLNICDESLQYAKISVLGSLDEQDTTGTAVDRLEIDLCDNDPKVRSIACVVIKNTGEKVATNAIIKRLVVALDDENTRVRWTACETVQSLGEKAATNAVINRL